MNKTTYMNKRGMAVWAIVFLFSLLAIGAGFAVWAGVTYLAVPVVPVAVDYDGEFDDAFLADKGNFYSTFTEGTDCNVTSDVLGASGYTNCIYDTNVDNATNGTEYRLDLVIDIDDDVENMEIEGKLQNTGTAQCADDMVIVEAEIWTYDDSDETILVYEIPIDNEDHEFEGETGILAGDEYVLHILLKSKLISPAFAAGDDIMLVKLDLTTDGDVDAARITLEE